ncbi:hypothetical protein [Mesorhizobium sp. B1-1-8]|uniref:hypothetical protein n=1 Tax=Mesorhizobium sp. B1-1-8 TaxID=2589976 RepID=UPI00112647AB|nr:hypothetical protein [Mesorhizobium sp. B1-1-8]UCI06547.1 hypothetical protein FJ974_22455 [Mesorhizobium sp. B1-1-8]
MTLIPGPLNQALRQAEAERLRKSWIEGLESGPFVEFNIEEIKLRAHVCLGSNPGPEQCR